MKAPRDDPLKDHAWMDTHEAYVNHAQNNEQEILFIGDDHVALLNNTQYYRQWFMPLHCSSFGIIGDKLEDVRWRVENGELDGNPMKMIVLSVGANDTMRSDEFLSSLTALTQIIREKQPDAKLFVMRLLPSGRERNARWKYVEEINERLEGALLETATVVDAPGDLLIEDRLETYMAYDYRHLTDQGYLRVFEPLYMAALDVLDMNDYETSARYSVANGLLPPMVHAAALLELWNYWRQAGGRRWRVENGELDGNPMKMIVLSVGANDTMRSDEFLSSLTALTQIIREKQPDAKLFVMRLLPSGRERNARWKYVEEINERLEGALLETATVVDAPGDLLIEDRLETYMAYDYRHLTDQGYLRVFEPLYMAALDVLDMNDYETSARYSVANGRQFV
ncbi:unnamed protein product, partial [Mesorhabditis spiculigera]